MAITCTPTITPVDVSNSIAKVEAVIQNGAEDPITVVVRNADCSTAPKRAVVADIVWAKYVAQRNSFLTAAALQTTLDTLETSLKSNIEGRTV
jgi:hypothetical protein